ncbi:MAG: hypothetical protein NXY57DRAFT_1070169 [Lentinula lateritia]|uniref:Uncharacterized protein n=1 Tax=Lentinula lateritia TaxID=40482 RepID=A0ABQ8V4Q3_9AGAR|nr:MAG: hypothetical protein NXY57DRAFT_1070169 [Lentinula lateritia]KAJ4473198.1 hypothetical protein C8R41DRAFT_924169 [Lentinula lateritia]
MLLGLPLLFSAVTLFVGPVQTFTFSVTPSPVDVGQAYEVVWDYVEGDAPDNSFGIEVQGEDGYLQWLGFFNSSGSTSATALPSVGFYTLAAYTNVPGIDNGTFYTTLFDAQESTTSMSNSEITKTSQSSTYSHSTTISVQTSSVSLSSSPLSSSFSPTTTTPRGPLSALFTSSFTSSSSSGSLFSSSTSSSSSSTTPSNSSSPEPPSNSTLSKPKRNTIIISVSTSAGGLIFFALFGIYCIRRRRRLRDIENEKLAATPYAYSQYAFRAGPTFGPSPTSSRTRIPPSKRSAPTSNDGHLPLNRNARNMRRLYDTSPPTYISIVA